MGLASQIPGRAGTDTEVRHEAEVFNVYMLLAIVASVVLLVPAQAGAVTTTLVADYQFQSTRSSTVPGAPDLVDVGGANTFITDTVDEVTRTVLSFPYDSGLSLSPTTSIVSSKSYSIVLLCRLDNITSPVDPWVRLVDFKDGGQ